MSRQPKQLGSPVVIQFVKNMRSITWSEGQHGAKDFIIEGDNLERPVTGAIWLSNSQSKKISLVLCGHGASGDRYQEPIPYLARQLGSLDDTAILSIDGPVHGLRMIAPGGREAFFKEMQNPNFIDHMVRDWTIAYETVVSEYDFKPEKLGYFGLSMGTMFGIPLLASNLNFDTAVIGLCGSSGAASLIGTRLLEDAAKISHPTFFIMQLEDELFDREGYLALFDALGAEDKRLHANPGLHPEVPTEEIDFSIDFLNQHLTKRNQKREIKPLSE